jgi:hypothetical protein
MAESILVPDWLPSSAAALEKFLESHPDAERNLSEILDKSLEKIDVNTGRVVIEKLDGYFGREITDMLFDMVQPDLKSQLPEFTTVIPDKAMSFLKKFTSVYGPKLVDLSEASNKTSAAALGAFLDAHPEAEGQAREILDKHLSKIDATTWNSVFASLDNYWGKESTDILFNTAQTDQASRLQKLADSVPPTVMNFLRKIISLYGPELTNAYVASNQLPHGWRTFYRDVYYDYVNQRSHIRIRLAKYNGEDAFIEGNADSILDLTLLLMQTIRFLPVPDFISLTMVDRFIQEADELFNFLQPPPPQEPIDHPESKSSAPDKKPKSETTK